MLEADFLKVLDLGYGSCLFDDRELELLEEKLSFDIEITEFDEPIEAQKMFVVPEIIKGHFERLKTKMTLPMVKIPKVSTQTAIESTKKPNVGSLTIKLPQIKPHPHKDYPKSPAPVPSFPNQLSKALNAAIEKSPSLRKRVVDSELSRNSSFTSFIQLPEYHPPRESDLIMYQKYINCLSMGNEGSEITKPEFPKCPTSTYLANYVHKKYIYDQFMVYQLKSQRSYHNKYANIKLRHHFDMELSRTVSRRFSTYQRS